jgi:hypothetical protein
MCKKSLLRMEGADSDILLMNHHQLMMKYAAQPSSSIIASYAVVAVHIICAQSKYSAQMCITRMQAYLGA